MKKKIQKPFNAEAAKRGAKVETREGSPVRIVCYDVAGTRFPILALVNYTINCKNSEDCFAYNIEGKLESGEIYNGRNDLVIVEEVEWTKFNVGDWVFMNTHGSQPWLITKVTPNYYEIKDSSGHITTKSHPTIDNLFHPWALKDAKPGDVLCYQDGRPFMLKELRDGYPVAYFGIDYEDSILIGNGMIWTKDSVRPATFTEYNRLFKQLRIENYEYNVDTHEITKQEIAWRNKEGLGTKLNGYYINIDSSISSYDNGILCKNAYNVFSTKKQAKAALAMARISQIMTNDKRFGGIITNEEWMHHDIYVILRYNNTLMVTTRHCYEYLSFHKREQAELFLKENEDLIKDYYMLD